MKNKMLTLFILLTSIVYAESPWESTGFETLDEEMNYQVLYIISGSLKGHLPNYFISPNWNTSLYRTDEMFSLTLELEHNDTKDVYEVYLIQSDIHLETIDQSVYVSTVNFNEYVFHVMITPSKLYLTDLLQTQINEINWSKEIFVPTTAYN